MSESPEWVEQTIESAVGYALQQHFWDESFCLTDADGAVFVTRDYADGTRQSEAL